jgi:hypothetical protein
VDAACQRSRHSPWICAALNLLPVLSMHSGLAKLAFKAQHCRIAATRRAG